MASETFRQGRVHEPLHCTGHSRFSTNTSSEEAAMVSCGIPGPSGRAVAVLDYVAAGSFNSAGAKSFALPDMISPSFQI